MNAYKAILFYIFKRIYVYFSDKLWWIVCFCSLGSNMILIWIKQFLQAVMFIINLFVRVQINPD